MFCWLPGLPFWPFISQKVTSMGKTRPCSSCNVLFILLIHQINFGSSFNHQELSQAAPINENLFSTNIFLHQNTEGPMVKFCSVHFSPATKLKPRECTFREINLGIKCVPIEANNNFGSSAQVLSSPPTPLPASDPNNNILPRLPYIQVWIYSIGSAFFISLSGIWGYLLLPLLTGAYQNHVMNVLVGLSCGSLITSSLCQLIPEAHELWLLSPDYMYISIFSMVGVWIILLIQNFSTIFRKVKSKKEECAENIKKISINNADVSRVKFRNGTPLLPSADIDVTYPLFNRNTSDISKSKINPSNTSTGTGPTIDIELKIPSSSSNFMTQSHCNLQNLGLTKNAKLSKLAIIILASDFMNNFMDGISIGASYSHLLSTGLKLTIAISFEEYTHKLGDFAIVFQSGIPMKRVLFWNYITSCACFLGVIIGIALGNLNWSKYILSFASGLFLYIALSNMIPEMQKMIEDSLKISKKIAIISLIEQHIGFILAFIALIIISTALNTDPTHP